MNNIALYNSQNKKKWPAIFSALFKKETGLTLLFLQYIVLIMYYTVYIMGACRLCELILAEDQNYSLLLYLGRVEGSLWSAWGSEGERTWHHTGRTWSNTAWQGIALSGAMKNNFLLKKQHEGRLLGLDTKNMSHAERMRAWLWPPDLNVKDRRQYCTCMPWNVYSTLISIWRESVHLSVCQPETLGK